METKTDKLQLTPAEWISLYEDCESSIRRGMPWDGGPGWESFKFETTTSVRGLEVFISGFLKTYDDGKTFSVDSVGYFEFLNDDYELEQDYEEELNTASERCYKKVS